jgi:hypothetical protein
MRLYVPVEPRDVHDQSGAFDTRLQGLRLVRAATKRAEVAPGALQSNKESIQ